MPPRDAIPIVIRLDLAATPWTAACATLQRTQAAVLAHLEPAGVWGDDRDWQHCRPGPTWPPPPGKP